MSRGSIGGVTVGNAWMRNNPDLLYPAGHEQMDDATLLKAITIDPTEFESQFKVPKPRTKKIKN